ncbi:LAQU0S10e03444g1_1 [Lachancea quebecensis]|uniref:LAQU0S10e03444g1_1 n=1 Tax=Lachancea quebecensis TaxID=1654605 RepID=A0A0P1L2D6_9SACH|nr:LAQU0S10e03444g1_1 [Lachancea quebecensis]
MPTSNSGATAQVSDQLNALKYTLLGDTFAKWNLMVSGQGVIENVVDVAVCGGDLAVEALDVLLSFLNFSNETKAEMGPRYYEVVSNITQKLQISSADPDAILLRKVQLANICAGDYEPAPMITNLQTCLLDVLKYKRRRFLPSKHRLAIIVELLACLSKNDGRLDPGLKPATQQLLLDFSRKYGEQLNFRYLYEKKANHSQPSNFQDYDPLSNPGIGDKLTIPLQTCPDQVDIYDPLDRPKFALSLHIYLRILESSSTDFFETESLWECGLFVLLTSSFLKSDDLVLKCCALRFFAYPYICRQELELKREPLELWLPHLVECFNYDNIPWWFDPFDTLTRLVDHYNETTPLNNPVSNFLFDTKTTNGIVRLLAGFLSLEQQTGSTIDIVFKLIKLCASLTSFDEKTRKLLLVDKSILYHAESGLQSHLNLLNSFLSHKDQHLDGLKGVTVPPIYDSGITLSWVLLLKSFSRSVTALRTFLKRNKLASLLLELVKVIFSLTKNYNFDGEQLINAEIQIMSAALGVLSNFVVEFSNLQSFVIENGVMDIVGSILKDPFFNDKIGGSAETPYCTTSNISTAGVQTNALWVLRHLMYNSHNDEKLELLSIIPMEVILQFVNNRNWLVQEQCFQLLRNLTCNSRRVVNMLLESFSDSDTSFDSSRGGGRIESTYLFEFLAHKLKMLDSNDLNQRKTLEGVLYVIVNITATNENKRQLVIEQDELLRLIKSILAENAESDHTAHSKTDIQIASLWILTNLIWASTTSNFHMHATEPHSVMDLDETNPARSSGGDDLQNNKTQSQESDDPYDEDMSDSFKDEEEENQDKEGGGSSPFADNRGLIDGFERSKQVRGASKLKISAAERCSKLVKMGFYDIVKLKTLDTQLRVREQAKLLLFHMELLRKGVKE